MDLLQDPRYKEAPVYLFFEKYIMDVIGELAIEKEEILQNIDLQNVFCTQATEWRDVVIEVLQLSSTINIAILEQWYKEQEKVRFSHTEINANQFSRNFVDRYFDENSSLDKWTEKTLADAKAYIYESQNLEKA